MGRLDEAVDAKQTTVALSPQDAEAHYNLGVLLQDLGRLEDAEASYSQALALKPDYAEAHYNLGITLKDLGRLEDSVASYTQATTFKPDYVEAHYNLGNTLRKLGRLEDSKTSYIKAVALKPEYIEALNNLAIVEGYMNNLKGEVVSLQNILQMDVDNYDLRARVNLAICKFLEGDFTESGKHLLGATKIREKTLPVFKPERIFYKYLSKILEWHEDKYRDLKKIKSDKDLYVIGESHSLTSHHLRIKYLGMDFFCNARLIKGCKQWHLGNPFRNQYKHQFESIF